MEERESHDPQKGGITFEKRESSQHLKGCVASKGCYLFRRKSCLLKGCLEDPLAMMRGIHIEGYD